LDGARSEYLPGGPGIIVTPLNTEYRVCSGADMQPGRQPWVQQNSERDSEGHTEQLFT